MAELLEGGLSVSLISLSLSTAASCFESVLVSMVVSAGSGSVAGEEGVFLDEVNVTKSSVPTSLRKKTMMVGGGRVKPWFCEKRRPLVMHEHLPLCWLLSPSHTIQLETNCI